jgi:hypothetical protein
VATGAVILTEDGSAFYGRVQSLNLSIRKSGSYKLKLIVDGTVYDTWDFSVTRHPTDAGQTGTAKYASLFSVSIETPIQNDATASYDEDLNRLLLNAITEESRKGNTDIFTQISPGKLVVQFDLNAKGTVGAPKIISNTLTEAIGEFFLRTLVHTAPYPSWSQQVRDAIGSDTRTMRVSFAYD